ncbi:FadR/GntR family transcriptional regulator [Agromyces larvae]|uniref:FCD domain-containing protein n=1 Tax=Agromyces larvae TaxID=2929802 RepID=A0ABY4C4F8_9MICO|nr:FCD domain-containing protein [Agromyces larvae]UOE43645.1 FCD domain-containing protein [Agromyces larvae]
MARVHAYERPSASQRAWQVVLEHIESQLLSGELAAGDRLPGERQLSTDLGVGRSSVREALRVLEAMGLVRTATGSGPTAGAIIVATPAGAMGALMRLQVAARGFPVADIVRTRLVLEASVVEELADADPAPSFAELDRLLDAMDAVGLAAEDFLALDAAFHLALAEASGNQVIAATMAGLRSGIEGYARAGVARIADWDATSARLRHEHRGVLEAIRESDAPLARTLIRDHIAGYYAETLAETSGPPPARPPAPIPAPPVSKENRTW